MTHIPELTDAEARMLLLLTPQAPSHDALHDLFTAGLISSWSSLETSGNVRADITDLGFECLAAYDAKKRAEIEAPFRDLLRRIVDFCDRGPKDPFTDRALQDADDFLRRNPT